VQFRARVEDLISTSRRALEHVADPGDSLRLTFRRIGRTGSYNSRRRKSAIDALSTRRSVLRRGGSDHRLPGLDRVSAPGATGYRNGIAPRIRSPIGSFSHPEKSPRYAQGVGAPENWWYDADKAAKLEQAK